MYITLEQARTFDAYARAGTLQAAGKALCKAHSAVMYALQQLEAQTQLVLLDRSGYRTRLTLAGEEVLRHCRKLLDAEIALHSACEDLQTGWEPALRVVFDAILPLAPVLEIARVLKHVHSPTRVQLAVDSLEGVEERFEREGAQVMIGILPPRLQNLTVTSLPCLQARLVAHRDHPLLKLQRPITDEDLAMHVLLTVRGSDPRLQLSTAALERQSAVHLSDFHAKKAGILAGIGFGWLPEWIMAKELAQGDLVTLHRAHRSVHSFEPLLAWRGVPGPATQQLISLLTSS